MCSTRDCSELDGVRGITSGKRESSVKVSLVHLVGDVLQQSGVDFLLESLSGSGGGDLWGVLGEELLGLSSGGLGLLGEGPVSDLVEANTLEGHLGAGGNSVALLNSSNWDTVDLVWAGNGNKT